ncbi:hypothetical protein [Candidatus Caldatribacterium sp.]|uniref:hypothetical protein n=1 Tax=Candidatus Caldatribacterium sp. TaxID=2282143 RepID=UPI002997E3AA|nr:hypothetical protein [Candidatus Caldatribacterium sp.]MDW8081235.1 hypothetical protein [Candidatus Calescibacterium sp.]
MRTLIVFGATGNLFTRRILPALARLSLEEEFTVVALGRRVKDTASYQAFIAPFLPKHSPLFERLVYLQGDLAHPRDLALKLSPLLKEGPLYFYLATLPSLYHQAIACVREIASSRNQELFIALEKPFGKSYEDFLRLEASLKSLFPEDHVFYVDHYLGKGTVQNLIILKAENPFLERLLSWEFVSEVRIGIFEEEGVGERATFYEETGAIRDIFQNHLLQMLTLFAVDVPPLCDEDRRECNRFFAHLAQERAKLLTSLRFPENRLIELGQYASYRDEVGNEHSRRETFFCFPVFIDTERWKNVPFYLASGKKLATKRSCIEVLFNSVGFPPNTLYIEIQPEERIDLLLFVRKPGRGLDSVPVRLNFTTSGSFQAKSPEAYENILYDFLHNDRTLFPDSSFVRESWKVTEKLLAFLEESPPRLCRYWENIVTPEVIFSVKRIPDEMCLGRL